MSLNLLDPGLRRDEKTAIYGWTLLTQIFQCIPKAATDIFEFAVDRRLNARLGRLRYHALGHLADDYLAYFPGSSTFAATHIRHGDGWQCALGVIELHHRAERQSFKSLPLN